MRYLIAGATSGTGNAVVKRLVKKVGLEKITCIARPSSDVECLRKLGVDVEVGDVTNRKWLKSLLNASVVYIDMTNPRYYASTMDVVVSAGVERGYFVSTTGIFSKYRRCADVYKTGEEYIRQSGLVFTILRPSMIYGHLRDRNMVKLIKYIDNHSLFPLFGDGSNLLQPVFVEDLAAGIVAAIGNPATENQEYNLAGADQVMYRDIIDLIATKLGHKVHKIRLNPAVVYYLVKAAQCIPHFPINDEQVLRMQEDKIFDISKATADLGYCPISFEEGINNEIEQLRAVGLI